MNGHRRRVIALTTAWIMAAALVAGGGWWLGQRDRRQPAAAGVTSAPPTNPPATATEPTPTTQPTPTTPTGVGIWQRLPAAPIPAGLYEFAGVWTGRELLVHGAVHDRGRPHAAGAAYDPSTNTWRKLPPAPGPAEVMEGGYTAVWAGTELLGGGLGLDAAYDPVSNRWRELTWRGDRNAVTVWTGRQVLTWGGGCCGYASADGWAYTPAANSWQQLPRGPRAGRHPTGAWTGTELVIVGGADADGRQFRDAAAYNPATRSWRRLPPMPEPRVDATATWTGSEVLVVGGYGGRWRHVYADGVAYSPATNRWRRLPAMFTGRAEHTAVWTDRQLLVWGGRMSRGDTVVAPPYGAAYDPASNRWSALPKSALRGRTGHAAVWTGTQMLIWGGTPVSGGGSAVDGAAYTPSPL